MTVEMFLALVNWHRDDPAACEDFCTKIGGAALVDAIRAASVRVLVDVGQIPTAARHGELPAPQLEQLLDADAEVFLAGGPLHDPCAGGEECDALCACEGGT